MNTYFAQVDVGFGPVQIEDFEAESLTEATKQSIDAAIRLSAERVGDDELNDRINNEKDGYDFKVRCWRTYGA